MVDAVCVVKKAMQRELWLDTEDLAVTGSRLTPHTGGGGGRLVVGGDVVYVHLLTRKFPGATHATEQLSSLQRQKRLSTTKADLKILTVINNSTQPTC